MYLLHIKKYGTYETSKCSKTSYYLEGRQMQNGLSYKKHTSSPLHNPWNIQILKPSNLETEILGSLPSSIKRKRYRFLQITRPTGNYRNSKQPWNTSLNSEIHFLLSLWSSSTESQLCHGCISKKESHLKPIHVFRKISTIYI